MKRIIFLFIILLTLSKNAHGSKIFITEIFPDPSGVDTNKEWIEIKNSENKPINLENWTIQTSKKSFNLENQIIEANSYAIINNIKLANNNEKITLKDNQGKTQNTINYAQSTPEKSYAITKIFEENLQKEIWTWTTPTKKSNNPILYETEGKILKEPEIKKEYQFYFLENNSNLIKITIDEKLFDINFLKTIFLKDTKLKIQYQKLNNNLILEKYELLNKIKTPENKSTNQKTPDWIKYLYIPILILITALYNTSHYKPTA